MSAETGARLRVLVCPHELITGGSQINAIDLAARIRDRGHEVRVFAPPGPLQSRIDALGLQYRPAPPMTGRALAPRTVRALRREIREFRPDIVHAYEHPPAVTSTAISQATRHRSVITVLSMDVPDFLPVDVPLIVGTADLARGQGARRGTVHLMEPPVDTAHDRPTDRRRARADLGLGDDRFVISVVGRLSSEHEKARGVAEAIAALAAAPLPRAVTFVVAGSGDDEEGVRAAAARFSAVDFDVRLEGDVADPRPVYAAADLVIGMGSSALRAMAHARPVVVQGPGGFWNLLSPDTIGLHLRQGFFGHGDSGGPSLAAIVSGVMADPASAEALGWFGRAVVEDRFAIDRAASRLEQVYIAEARGPRAPGRRSAAYALWRYLLFRVALTHPRAHSAFRRVVHRHG